VYEVEVWEDCGEYNDRCPLFEFEELESEGNKEYTRVEIFG